MNVVYSNALINQFQKTTALKSINRPCHFRNIEYRSVRSSRIFCIPPRPTAQKRRLSALPPHKANASKHSMVLQSVFNCHIFCGYATQAFGTLPVPLCSTAKEPSQHTAQQQKNATLQPPPPFRLCQYKNCLKLNNIMWHYSTASCHAYASIQPHSQSYNNIMLNSQYHSHFDKMEAVFSPIAQPPKATHPNHPFQRCRKK